MNTPLTGEVPPLTDTELVQAAPYVFGLLDGAIATIADLRAVLAPLLDNPIRPVGCESDGGEVEGCIVCEYEGHAAVVDGQRQWVDHAPDCPVLRRDELLGRA